MRKLFFTVLATSVLSAQGFAGVCDGKVAGLSSHYDPATGSGFLAVRADPNASAQKVGELYNGAGVEIDARQGGWYMIVSKKDEHLSGWVSTKWISTACNW